MATREQLETRYSKASDTEVREALAAGQASFEPDAWDVITAEAARRGPGLAAEPTPAAEPSGFLSDIAARQVDSVKAMVPGADDGLSASARNGRTQIVALMVLFAGVAAVSALLLLTVGVRQFTAAIVSTTLVLALGVHVAEGRAWARWVMIVVFTYFGGTAIYAALAFPGTDLASLWQAVMAIVYAMIPIALLVSPAIRAFFRESAQRRAP